MIEVEHSEMPTRRVYSISRGSEHVTVLIALQPAVVWLVIVQVDIQKYFVFNRTGRLKERMKTWAEAAWSNCRMSLADALDISEPSSKVPVMDARIR